MRALCPPLSVCRRLSSSCLLFFPFCRILPTWLMHSSSPSLFVFSAPRSCSNDPTFTPCTAVSWTRLACFSSNYYFCHRYSTLSPLPLNAWTTLTLQRCGETVTLSMNGTVHQQFRDTSDWPQSGAGNATLWLGSSIRADQDPIDPRSAYGFFDGNITGSYAVQPCA